MYRPGTCAGLPWGVAAVQGRRPYMEDMFVAKLKTTAEATPACLLAGGGVEAGSCYVGNRCYADGNAARGGAPCVGCDADARCRSCHPPIAKRVRKGLKRTLVALF